MKEVRECAMPDCSNKCAAIARRGKNSPMVQAGGDSSKRSRYCRFHLKGKGKAERIGYLQGLN